MRDKFFFLALTVMLTEIGGLIVVGYSIRRFGGVSEGIAYLSGEVLLLKTHQVQIGEVPRGSKRYFPAP